jgi:hypothetical protein
MNDTTRLEVRPEVADFLDKVRARLSDLTEEQRDDLLGGLEADICELVDDGGSVAELGDPRAYADELRSAAGVSPAVRRGVRRPRMPRRPTRESVAARLDESRARWEQLMTSRPWLVPAWEVVQTLRPAWWVLRAWVAVQVLDMLTGPWEYRTLVPRFGDDLSGLLLLVGAVVGSVLLGLRKTWPASHAPRSVLARVVLLALNGFAALMVLAVVNGFPPSSMLNDYAHPNASGMFRPFKQPGVQNDGHLVRNVFAYDAEGNPLQGVQLYDQRGNPLAVDPNSVYRVRYAGSTPVVYSWMNGDQAAWNVYPLPVRFDGGWSRRDKAWTSDNPPFLPQPPLVAVAPVTLPLSPAAADQPQEPDAEAQEPDANAQEPDAGQPSGDKPTPQPHR